MDKKAYYNALRLSWQQNPNMDVEYWEVTDYRSLESDELFDELEELGIELDDQEFIELSERFDMPEELSEALTEDFRDTKAKDHFYLLIFELWRRLAPEKLTLGVFCDELDFQIENYQKEGEEGEAVQDVIANFENLLNENADAGEDPGEVFEYISEGCVHNLENFLYDFIAEQIDNKNLLYASDILDGFADYVHEVAWFDYLRACIAGTNDIDEGIDLINEILDEVEGSEDLEFYLEVMLFVVQSGSRDLFAKVGGPILKLIDCEEDFIDFLFLCIDYLRLRDQDEEKEELEKLLKKRTERKSKKEFSKDDADLQALVKIVDREFSLATKGL